jgi:hypothetical protein
MKERRGYVWVEDDVLGIDDAGDGGLSAAVILLHLS